MSYAILYSEELEKAFQKFRKKDPALYTRLFKKIISIAQKPYQGKPLRNVLKNRWRTQIGHYVLVYRIDEENKTIELIEFDHHDKVYK